MIKKYLRVYKVFIENAFSYDVQYRGDTILKLISNMLWVGMLFLTIEIIFSHTTSIVGWSKQEVYLMTVIWVIADELFSGLFSANIFKISNYVTDGELDVLITKPISTLFIVSNKHIMLRAFYRLLMQLPILFWIIHHFQIEVTLVNSLLATLLILVAVWIDYSRCLIANTLSFWFHRIENVNDLIGTMNTLGKYPLSIWPRTVKIILLTALPIAFSGFMPTATLVGRWPWYGVLYAFVFAVVLCVLAVQFWNFALRRYSSASS